MTQLPEAAALAAIDRAVYSRLTIADMSICVREFRGLAADLKRVTGNLKEGAAAEPRLRQQQIIVTVLGYVEAKFARATGQLDWTCNHLRRDIHRIGPDGLPDHGPTDVRRQLSRAIDRLGEAVTDPRRPSFPDVASCLFEGARALAYADSLLAKSTGAIYAETGLSRISVRSTSGALYATEITLHRAALPLKKLAELDFEGSVKATTRAGRKAATGRKR